MEDIWKKEKIEDKKEYSLGNMVLTEEDIISFAKHTDPLPFHTDPEFARKSHFHQLVASGPHLFTAFYRDRWLPLFGYSVLAGVEVRQWRLMRPVYPGRKLHAVVCPHILKRNKDKGHMVVEWKYKFENEDGNLLQDLYVTILHKMD